MTTPKITKVVVVSPDRYLRGVEVITDEQGHKSLALVWRVDAADGFYFDRSVVYLTSGDTARLIAALVED